MENNKLTIGERAEKSWLLHMKGKSDDYCFAYVLGATEQDSIARQEERERCIQIAQKLLCEKCLGNNECSICGDYGAPSATGWMCTKRLLIREAIEKGGQ